LLERLRFDHAPNLQGETPPATKSQATLRYIVLAQTSSAIFLREAGCKRCSGVVCYRIQGKNLENNFVGTTMGPVGRLGPESGNTESYADETGNADCLLFSIGSGRPGKPLPALG
jgi:hypothetical protein